MTQTHNHSSLVDNYVPRTSPDDSYAHDWSTNVKLSIEGKHFVDRWGRVCLPRGVNLSGSSKLPTNHNPEIFLSDHKNVTFSGRPFSLQDAPEHFARLRRHGLTFVRFLVTWEALEHGGPGVYDVEYLDYLRNLLDLMSEFGITVIVAMHQDVWSRFSGGSGAPAWTLEAVGFDLQNLEESGAAYLGGVRKPGHEEIRGRWPTGYTKLACATMWTCFWAGNTFAPKLKVRSDSGELIGIQPFLQSAFFNCFDCLARKLGSLASVAGFEVLNEPHMGYINVRSLHSFNYYTELHFGDAPSAFQSFVLGAGHQVSVPHYTRSFPFPTTLSREITRNTNGVSVWRSDGPTAGQCLWGMHGVWGWDTKKNQAVVLRESYFTKHPMTGQKIDWYIDIWYPFVSEWAARIHANAGIEKFVFVEPIPNEFCPPSWVAAHRPRNMVFAPHWYDLNALFTKKFGNMTVNVQGLSRGMFLLRAIYWGVKGARDNYRCQISTLVNKANSALGDTPVFVGECGVPMDMNNGEAFRSGDFHWQERMADALLHALETTMVGFTLWNYNPDNTDTGGDYWNGENFSWDDATLDQGVRLLSSIVRPYPAKVAGLPVYFDYQRTSGAFKFTYLSHPGLKEGGSCRSLESQIFIPSSLALGRRMLVSGLEKGDRYHYDIKRQTLFVVHANNQPGARHSLSVTFDPPVSAPISLWSKNISALIAIAILLLSLVLLQ